MWEFIFDFFLLRSCGVHGNDKWVENHMHVILDESDKQDTNCNNSKIRNNSRIPQIWNLTPLFSLNGLRTKRYFHLSTHIHIYLKTWNWFNSISWFLDKNNQNTSFKYIELTCLSISQIHVANLSDVMCSSVMWNYKIEMGIKW